MAPLPPAPELSDPELSDAELLRRRRQRNIAMLVVLLSLSGLFFAISLVKLSKPVAGG